MEGSEVHFCECSRKIPAKGCRAANPTGESITGKAVGVHERYQVSNDANSAGLHKCKVAIMEVLHIPRFPMMQHLFVFA